MTQVFVMNSFAKTPEGGNPAGVVLNSHFKEEKMLKIASKAGFSETAFLKEAIQKYYASRNTHLELDEIFISDGAKSDVGNILDLFDQDNTVLVPNPVYPVYVDTNVMAGRKIVFADANEANDFLPMPDENIKADIIYICSPNNPTGAVYTKEGLKKWVDYALKNNAIILYDAAYECFIKDKNLPRSIFEIEGAKKCAIEFCSFSKTAGFTGTRCGYTIVPQELVFDGVHLNKLIKSIRGLCFGAGLKILPNGNKREDSRTGFKIKNFRISQDKIKVLMRKPVNHHINCKNAVNQRSTSTNCHKGIHIRHFVEKGFCS